VPRNIKFFQSEASTTNSSITYKYRKFINQVDAAYFSVMNCVLINPSSFARLGFIFSFLRKETIYVQFVDHFHPCNNFATSFKGIFVFGFAVVFHPSGLSFFILLDFIISFCIRDKQRIYN